MIPSEQQVLSGEEILLPPGSLAASLEARTLSALRCGALQPIETRQERVEDGGVRFLVRIVSSLRRKAEARRDAIAAAGPAVNPFFPPEPDLSVAAVTRSHLAVLNKFNVLERHLLIVTRSFESQETLLNTRDFLALVLCLAELPSLGFYNGGAVAGASQTHKHLQLIPVPFDDAGPSVPMEPLLKGEGPHCPALPFPHAFGRLRTSPQADPLAAAAEAHSLYRTLLTGLGIGAISRDGADYQTLPYNLLVTHHWMLAVPRTQESWCGISINALGFAGSVFVRESAQLELIRAAGPMQVLQAVTR